MKPYLKQFDVDKLEMASVMGICAGLLEPKSENVEKVLVFKAFLKGSRRAGVRQENKRPSGKWDFGVTLGSVWGHIGMTLGNFGVTLVRL